MKLLVSACLMGLHCRYDGKSNELPQLDRLMEEYTCIPVCPEMFGGLPTPRQPAERRKERIVDRNGRDVTDAYIRGTAEVIRLARLNGCKAALLKERSPSCGCGAIYDGSFTGRLIEGDGLTAQMLRRQGVAVYGESQIEALLPENELMFGTMMGFLEEIREEERAAVEAAIAAAEAAKKAEAQPEQPRAVQPENDTISFEDFLNENPFRQQPTARTEPAPAYGGERACFPEEEEENPFARLMRSGSLEIPKPEPVTRPAKNPRGGEETPS